jgi:hypothetical protein
LPNDFSRNSLEQQEAGEGAIGMKHLLVDVSCRVGTQCKMARAPCIVFRFGGAKMAEFAHSAGALPYKVAFHHEPLWGDCQQLETAFNESTTIIDCLSPLVEGGGGQLTAGGAAQAASLA